MQIEWNFAISLFNRKLFLFSIWNQNVQSWIMDAHGEIDLIESPTVISGLLISANCQLGWWAIAMESTTAIYLVFRNGITSRKSIENETKRSKVWLSRKPSCTKKGAAHSTIINNVDSTFTENCLPNSKIHLITWCRSNLIRLFQRYKKYPNENVSRMEKVPNAMNGNSRTHTHINTINENQKNAFIGLHLSLTRPRCNVSN